MSVVVTQEHSTQEQTKRRHGQASNQEESPLLTVHEIAQELRVDDTTVRRWIKNGALEAVSLPHVGLRQAYRVKRDTLDALLAKSVQI